jgi:hypothetical protein
MLYVPLSSTLKRKSMPRMEGKLDPEFKGLSQEIRWRIIVSILVRDSSWRDTDYR